MYIHILGSGAGGGFPQWNCHCRQCQGVRDGTIQAQARTQSSIAVSADGIHWILINASPDIRQQIEQFPKLTPGRAVRDTAISAVVLIDSQIDHTTGLLTLREGDTLELYCTEMVHQDLTSGFPILNMLQHYCGVNWHAIGVGGEAFTIPQADGIKFYPVSLSSKAPPYSPHRHDPHPGDNIGLKIEDTKSGRNLFYAPGLGEMDKRIAAYMQDADLLLVDGTCWRDDEMSVEGVGHKLASEMGHLAQSGNNGLISVLENMSKPRKVLVHINNTNPILNENSPQRALLEQHQIEVAYDGMDLEI